MTLRLGQDKPDFVRRRVRKLLTAGVVSALACMVKSENPALTSSCRELISRYGVRGVAEELRSEAAGVLLANSCARAECQLLGAEWKCLGVWHSLGPLQGSVGSPCGRSLTAAAPALSPGCSWHWWRRRRTGAVWLHREEAR